MLADRHRPNSIREIIGNSSKAARIKELIETGKNVIVHGPPGCGKSISVELASRELGYEVLEYTTAEAAMKASVQRSLFFKKKLILIDIDSIKTTAKKIKSLIDRSECPVVIVTTDAYSLNPGIRRYFELVKFIKVRYDLIANLLRKVCEKEGISHESRALNQVAMMSNGDVRAAFIDLGSVDSLDPGSVKTIGHREKEENIFNTLKVIFRTREMSNVRIAVNNCEKPVEELFLWVEENIPEEYGTKEEIAKAYDYLSKADLFAARIIKRQAWSLQKYTLIFAYGTSLSKSNAKSGYVMYKSPKIFYRKKGTVSKKISKKLHISTREAEEYRPIISRLSENALKQFGFDEKELEEIEA